MKQYFVKQAENGWIVVEGNPVGMSRDYGMMGKEYVFADSEAMGKWFAMRDVNIAANNSELSK